MKTNIQKRHGMIFWWNLTKTIGADMNAAMKKYYRIAAAKVINTKVNVKNKSPNQVIDLIYKVSDVKSQMPFLLYINNLYVSDTRQKASQKLKKMLLSSENM